jgi:hypothetical protein
MKFRKTIVGVSLFGSLGLIIGASVFYGYLVGYHEFSPFKIFRTAERVVQDRFGIGFDSGSVEKRISSIFLDLKSQGAPVAVARKGAGGGLTSFGDAVLLITHEGKIYSARSANDIRETGIQTPDSGFRAYEKAALTGKYRNFNHNFGWFRYNDILHYRLPSHAGLAISYMEFNEKKECYGNTIAVLPLDPGIQKVEQISAGEKDWEVIYRTSPCLPLKKEMRAIEGHIAGGRMAFSPPGKIFLGSGDFHWDGVYAPEALAQRPDAHYGKVIAIDLASRQAKIVSSGNRNIQGIVFDRSGQLWVAEHGARGGDELNRIVPGANYGWPKETLGTRYNKMPWPNTLSYGRHETFTAPTYAWLPSVAISSLTLIAGFHKSWDGDLLMATLKDRALYRIRIRDDRVLFAERIPIGERIRYVHQHNDGRLVLWTDSRKLIFLSIAERRFVTDFVARYMGPHRRNEIWPLLKSLA